jgi:hypothetical protein
VQLPSRNASRAVLIGCSNFQYLDSLPAVRNNIAALSKCFLNKELWGLQRENLTEVVDPITNPEMLDPIHTAAEDATDTLMIYYAGHGIVDRRSNLLLALKGSVSNKPYTATPYENIRDIVIETRARRRIVILDCCYSGRALGTMGVSTANAAEAIAQSADAEGTFVLAAAAENTTALAPPDEEYTAFTGELVWLLENGDPDGPDLWNMDSLYRTLFHKLKARGRPAPQKRDRNTVGDMPIFRNRAKAVPKLSHTTQTESPPGIRYESFVRDFVERAMPTSQVQELLGLHSPQAVHRLRVRGKLIGAAVGNRTWFPAWQFDDDRLRPDLPQILELLARLTSDPFAADSIMRSKHDELGGVSIAEALRQTQTAGAAWRMLAAVGA